MADTNLTSILLVLGNLSRSTQISQRRLTRVPELESTPPLIVLTGGNIYSRPPIQSPPI